MWNYAKEFDRSYFSMEYLGNGGSWEDVLGLHYAWGYMGDLERKGTEESFKAKIGGVLK